MSATLLDFSQRRELALHARVAAAVPPGCRCSAGHTSIDRWRVCARPSSALPLLKIICWHERHRTSPRKDAHDLHLILRNYLDAGNTARLWEEFIGWTQDEAFEYELAGARMLGHDVRLLLDDKGIRRVSEILLNETQSSPTILPNQMNPDDPSRAETLLAAMFRGLDESSHK